MRKKEEEIHLRVCDYLRRNYPDVLFRTDFSSGMKMSPGQAAKHKKFQKRRAWRTIAIAMAVAFCALLGLFVGSEIELKNTKTKLEATINGSQDYYCKKGE